MRGTTLTIVLALLLSPFPTAAQDSSGPSVADLERRIRDLEALVQQLMERQKPVESIPSTVEEPAPSTEEKTESVLEEDGASSPLMTGAKPAAPKPPAVAGWNNGFFLQAPDKKYQLRITGQIQTDYRAFLDGPDSTDIDTFLVRRARLGIEATMFEYYEFRLLPDFGQGQARIQDSYLNIHYWDPFQVETGKFKQPFSYEQLIQDRFVPTMERSIIDQLVPARDVGVMLHGQKLFDNRLDWAVSVSNGEINGDTDTNDTKDIVGRVAVRPFGNEERALQWLQFGISASTAVENEPILPATLRTPATVPFFAFNPGVRANGLRNRWSPEISYFLGPWGFAAQYFRQDQEISLNLNSPRLDIPFEGGYVLVTLLLTGERRTTYSQAIVPLSPFEPRAPLLPGAWELVARVSRLNVGDAVFQGPAPLADPARFSSGCSETTLGFNWYLNAWARVQMNWEHAWFDDPVRLDPSGLLSHQDTILTRFQIIF